jgi:excisionase family DNA binding protein
MLYCIYGKSDFYHLLLKEDLAVNLFKVTEAAEYLGVSSPTIYKLVREGRLAYYQLGDRKATRFAREDLDAFRESSRVGVRVEARKEVGK